MTNKKFDIAFESIMAGSIPEKQSFFEKLVIDAIIRQIEDVLGIDATYIGNYTFEWKFANNFGCLTSFFINTTSNTALSRVTRYR